MATKPVRASRTMWGLLLVFLPLLQQLGVQLDLQNIIEMGNQIDQMVLIATQLVGIILAIYGRFKAKKELVFNYSSLMEIPNGCLDLPSERDWNYGLFGTEEIPQYINLGKNISVQDQGIKNNPSTSMACVFYAMTHGVNANNTYDDGNVLLQGNEERAKFINDPVWIAWYDNQGVNRITQGSYIQHGVEFAKEKGYISAYFLCNSNELKRQALSSFRAVHTGTSKIDWKATKLNNAIAVEGDGAAHSIELIGYDLDKEWFIAINSRGDDWGDKGLLYIPFEMAERVFFSAYALIDLDDKPLIDAMIEVRDKIIETAKQKIKDGVKLKARETIALRAWGYSHLIP